MNIAVYGAGYVGMVTAACLAKLGHRLWIVEVVEEKLRILREGGTPVVEPNLPELVAPLLQSGQIVPISEVPEAVAATDLSLVCVGTPSLSDGRLDIRQVKRVIADIGGQLSTKRGAHVVALRSTLPYPVIAAEIEQTLKQAVGDRFGTEIGFAVNPEFLREGSAIRDFFEPALIVVGTDHDCSRRVLQELYEPIKAPFYAVSPGSASLLKYACNAFHAAKIAFANQIGAFGGLFGADAVEVMDLLCRDKILNVSSAYLRPGYAYGGSCLPKDLSALIQIAYENAADASMLEGIRAGNRALIDSTIQFIEESESQNLVLIGLSFKSGVDDLRESPFVELAERLIGKGYDLTIYDPDIDAAKLIGRNLQFAQRHLRHLAKVMSADLDQSLEHADLIIVGKRLVSLQQIKRFAPRGVPLLDLTRELRGEDAGLEVYELGGAKPKLRQPTPV